MGSLPPFNLKGFALMYLFIYLKLVWLLAKYL